ncbi:uncharacterized protein LOC133194309 [Saccostrea echinata]|uniref:uncharacterized protein LOC133194309 n=1 Tax=Saccostrea echinata TaxID=191078 RepID=UPI002A82CD0E|nr:uncharacterized protein LOC133194309 [Saccostrea echinata]
MIMVKENCKRKNYNKNRENLQNRLSNRLQLHIAAGEKQGPLAMKKTYKSWIEIFIAFFVAIVTKPKAGESYMQQVLTHLLQKRNETTKTDKQCDEDEYQPPPKVTRSLPDRSPPSVRSSVLELLQQAREEVLRKEGSRLDFDDPSSLADTDYYNLTGLSRVQFDDLMCGVHNIRATQTRSIRTCIAILLMKLKSGLDNQMLATLFNMTKFQIRRAVHSARRALMKDFVSRNMGFAHITRNDIIDSHTRPLAQQMFSTVGSTPAILVLDGTYIYIQKSGNYTFSRRSYSMHKHRPLLKPMMIVSTTGYIVSVFGPYLADPRNNDMK